MRATVALIFRIRIRSRSQQALSHGDNPQQFISGFCRTPNQALPMCLKCLDLMATLVGHRNTVLTAVDHVQVAAAPVGTAKS